MAIIHLGNDNPKNPLALDAQLKKMLLVIGVMAIVAGGMYIVRALWPVALRVLSILSPFIGGLILAYVFNPIVSGLQRTLRVGRAAALIIVSVVLAWLCVMALSVLIGLAWEFQETAKGIPQQVADRLGEWWVRANSFFDGAQGDAAANGAQAKERIAKMLENAAGDAREWAAKLFPSVRDGTMMLASGVASGLDWILSGITFLIFAGLISFYSLLDMHKIPRIARILTPVEYEERLGYLARRLDEAVGGYLRGQMMVCVIMGLLISVWLLIMGMKQWALLIGCLAGAINFIPYLGVITGLTPAFCWALFTGSMDSASERLVRLALLLAGFAAIQAIEGFVLQPKIVGKHAELHPLAVLFALIVGAQFGIGGMIAAVPIACAARVLIKEYWWDALSDQDRRRNSP
ncbi:MAG: AI-2 transport protein TqsA [candidate division BRC1 bacterium ADurb.BinA364]|nr:MAG: AI-2 transport protein TqsA [candidate division BRC1 bacterium ADurb.BinA364]